MAQLGLTLLDLWEPDAPARVAPTEFRLFAKGVNKSDQGDFLWDEEAEASVMRAFNERARELVIDYEHQSMAQPPVKAHAAGWFKLAARDGELWATEIRWVEETRAEIEKGQYRYWSPTFKYDLKNGRVLEVFNNALTNNPSLYGIPALVAASMRFGTIDTQEDEMPTAEERLTTEVAELRGQLAAKDTEITNLKGSTQTAQLSTLVGLRAGAAQEEIQGAVTALVGLRSRLFTVTGKDSAEAALGTIEGWKSEAADAARLRAEAEAIVMASCKKQIAEILDEAVKAGKIAPSERGEWEKDAIELHGGKPSEKGVTWLKSRTGAMGPRNTSTPTLPAAGAGGEAVPPSQLAMLSNMGLPADEFAKWKAGRTAPGAGTHTVRGG